MEEVNFDLNCSALSVEGSEGFGKVEVELICSICFEI